MKKHILALFLIGVLSLTTACNSGRINEGQLSTVKEGTIILATNAEFPPFEYVESGDVVGFDIDVANEIATALGLTLKIENMNFDSVVTAVKSGRADIAIAGLTVNEERLNEVDFSNSYYRSSQVIIVPTGSAIAGIGDLSDKKVGVQLGTTGDFEMSTGDFGATVERYSKPSDAVNDLKAGRLDAIVIDSNPAQVFVGLNEDTLTLLSEPLTDEDYAIGISKSNSGLTTAINGVLAELELNGKMDELKLKYDLQEATAD